MDKKNIKRKAIMTLIMTSILLVVITMDIQPAIAATEGTSSGTASVGNSAPTISSANVTDVGDVDKDTAQIDVNVEYWINAIIVDDDNSITDLNYVEYVIWGPSSSYGGGDAEATHYTFRWTQTTDEWTEEGPDSAGDSHLVLANCTDPASLPGDFRLAFKLDKIAEKTATNTWSINATVFDDAGANAKVDSLTFGVNYYGELTVDDATHGWAGLTAEDSDVLLTSPGDFDIDVTVTSNAAFDLQAKGSGALTSGGDTIGLGNVTIHEDTLGSSVALTTSYADIGGLTGESAGSAQAKSFKLWIDVPADTPTGDYTYTLYVQVIEA